MNLTKHLKHTLIGCACFALSTSALGHHSFSAEFDADSPIKISGKVTDMKWSNPHGWIYIAVTNEDGTVTDWALETSAANNLIRRGWRKADLPVGTHLEVEGWQARNGSATANIRSVLLDDGRRLFAGTSNQSATE